MSKIPQGRNFMKMVETERKTRNGKWKQQSGNNSVSKTVDRLDSPSEKSDKMTERVSPFTQTDLSKNHFLSSRLSNFQKKYGKMEDFQTI